MAPALYIVISRMKAFGIPQYILKIVNLRICILEGPEDDPVRVETCCPKQYRNIIRVFVFD